MASRQILDDESQQALEDARNDGQLSGLRGMEIVLTGRMSLERADMVRLITALGGHVANTITTRTSILVTSDIHSNSGKMQVARARNMTIYTEEQFVEFASGHGAPE